MDLSQRGLNFIKRFEGLYLYPYRDVGGKWTVGYGHLIEREKLNSFRLKEMTVMQAEALLLDDLVPARKVVLDHCHSFPKQHEFDAMVSLAFNIGPKAFSNSTLLKLANKFEWEKAAEQFDQWTKVNGQVVKGLVKRRAAERRVFAEGIYGSP